MKTLHIKDTKPTYFEMITSEMYPQDGVFEPFHNPEPNMDFQHNTPETSNRNIVSPSRELFGVLVV